MSDDSILSKAAKSISQKTTPKSEFLVPIKDCTFNFVQTGRHTPTEQLTYYWSLVKRSFFCTEPAPYVLVGWEGSIVEGKSPQALLEAEKLKANVEARTPQANVQLVNTDDIVEWAVKHHQTAAYCVFQLGEV